MKCSISTREDEVPHPPLIGSNITIFMSMHIQTQHIIIIIRELESRIKFPCFLHFEEGILNVRFVYVCICTHMCMCIILCFVYVCVSYIIIYKIYAYTHIIYCVYTPYSMVLHVTHMASTLQVPCIFFACRFLPLCSNHGHLNGVVQSNLHLYQAYNLQHGLSWVIATFHRTKSNYI